MNSEEQQSDHVTEERNPGEWLNLSLGKDPSNETRSSESPQRAPAKIFSCNYCMRKFYSSQALGGHQNAHKRERGAVKYYQSQMMMAPMIAIPVHGPMFRSLGVSPHSLIHKPSRDGGARFSEASARFGIPWQPAGFDEAAAGMIWPGSFRFDPQQEEQQQSSDTNALDLNLKL